jgi:diguanylate cyclase (GGDEF)-like protein
MSAASPWVDVGTLVTLLVLGLTVRDTVSTPRFVFWMVGSVALIALRFVLSRNNRWDELRPGVVTRTELTMATVAGLLGGWIVWFYRALAPIDDAILFSIVVLTISVWWVASTAVLAATPLSFAVLSVCLVLGPCLAYVGRDGPWADRIWMTVLLDLAVIATYVDRRVAYVRSVEAEDEVYARAAEVELAFEAMRDGLVVTRDEVTIRANPAVGQLLRRGEGELIGRRLSDLFGPAAVDLEVGVTHRLSVDRLDGSTHVIELVGRATDDADAVEVAVWVCRDISEQVEREAQLRSMVDQDDLTGLANRRAMFEAVEAALGRGAEVAVLVIDVDDFKGINDRHGHAIGDLVLQSVAGRLQTRVAGSGLVARPGGDEFVVVLTEPLSVQGRSVLAQSLVDESRQALVVGGSRLTATLSIGIATGVRPRTAEVVLHDADLAMYRSKRAGRDTWRESEPFPFAAFRGPDGVDRDAGDPRLEPGADEGPRRA